MVVTHVILLYALWDFMLIASVGLYCAYCFSLGWKQIYYVCMWLCSVDAGFDEYDIPLDVIWLDIEHTDGKR